MMQSQYRSMLKIYTALTEYLFISAIYKNVESNYKLHTFPLNALAIDPYRILLFESLQWQYLEI